MILSYKGPCQISTHLDMPSLYFLYNHFPQTGTLKICSGIFTRQFELNFGMRQLFGQEKMSKKFGLNWAKINGTCFTNIISVQKLVIIMVIEWINEIYLLHNLKILPETKICSCAHIDDCMGLQMGGMG